MAPISKDNWLDVGLEILGREGISAITIDRMTTHLGVTKGSFYHHFKNIQHFRQLLLDAWEQDTVAIIQSINQQATALNVLKQLMVEFEARSPLPEIAIRAWAMEDAVPREVITRLDSGRLTFLTGLLSRLIPDAARADIAAKLLYTSIIGSLTIHPPLEMSQLKRCFGEFLQLYRLEARDK